MVPPIGWRFLDKETGHEFVAGDFNSLCFNVGAYYSVNDRTVPENLPEIVEDWICQQLTDSLVVGGPMHAIRDRRYVTYGMAYSAVKKICERWRDMGRKYVSLQTAEARAKICSDCKFNMPSAACSQCKGLDTWLVQYIRRQTHMDDNLSVCQVTVVMNRAHIHFTEDVLRSATPSNLVPLHPDECWKRKLLEADHVEQPS
ncbi:MAG: hypothetical protein IH951_11810 [Bacteroidetes bacterium]|nr:hypothetical protein [Bacteroidota bacterium]